MYYSPLTPFDDDYPSNELNRPDRRLSILKTYKNLLKNDKKNASLYFISVVLLYFDKDEIPNLNWMMDRIK